MTLVVSVHECDPSSGEVGPSLVLEPGAELAGFEVWRTVVYGSEAMRRRGARFLPRLASSDLLLEGSDLLAFHEECADLIRDIGPLSAELGLDVDTLGLRLSNIAAAVDRAISIGGFVWIS